MAVRSLLRLTLWLLPLAVESSPPTSDSPVLKKSSRPSVSLTRILGVVLITAGTLKGVALLTGQSGRWNTPMYRVFHATATEFELCLGLWLILGCFPRQAWFASLTCFVVFEFVSFHHALSGMDSCGCFGMVRINPWISVAFDFGAILALACYRPESWHRAVKGLPAKITRQPSMKSLRWLFLHRPPACWWVPLLCGVFLAVAFPIAVMTAKPRSASAHVAENDYFALIYPAARFELWPVDLSTQSTGGRR